MRGEDRTTMLAVESPLHAQSWRGARPKGIVAGALLSLACIAASARADELAKTVDELLAQNRPADALPLAVVDARELETSKAAWEKVLTISGWTSDTRASIEALGHLIALDPDNRGHRFALAQRLLWEKRTADAVPHARWLLAQADERSAAELEVITWVLLDQGLRNEARIALYRWITASPADPRPRWILADLTHWDVRWREALAQYEVLALIPSEAARAEARMSMLRHDHPNDLHLDGLHWHDNFGVTYEALALGSTLQPADRLVLTLRSEVGRWSQTRQVPTGSAAGGSSPTAQSDKTAELTARASYDLWKSVSPELALGGAADSEGNFTPIAGVAARLSIAGRLFGRVYVDHDRHRVSLDAARQGITTTGPGCLLYAEISRWFFASSEAMVQWVSDHNIRGRALLIAGAHNPDPLQLEPRLFVQYEAYRDARPGAIPYFTPTDSWTYGADLVGRYRLDTRFGAEAQIGLVVQGDVVALRPGGAVRAEIADHLRASFGVAYIGSPQYNQTRFDASVGYLF